MNKKKLRRARQNVPKLTVPIRTPLGVLRCSVMKSIGGHRLCLGHYELKDAIRVCIEDYLQRFEDSKIWEGELKDYFVQEIWKRIMSAQLAWRVYGDPTNPRKFSWPKDAGLAQDIFEFMNNLGIPPELHHLALPRAQDGRGRWL